MAGVVERLVAQGAEARLYETEFLGRPAMVKERFPKRYRHPTLDDKLIRERLGQEARSMQRARRAGVDVPTLYFVDPVTSRLYMERVHGVTGKVFLSAPSTTPADRAAVTHAMGVGIARLHNAGILHGDLTTSNVMVRDVAHMPDGGVVPALAPRITQATASGGAGAPAAPSYRIAFIDFGLSSQNGDVEGKGVDLYVLQRALVSAHDEELAPVMFDEILAAYMSEAKDAAAVARKFDAVRRRGRKRLAFG